MGSDNFDITFTLDGADSRKNAGTLFSISDTMVCKVNKNGHLSFEMTDTNGTVSSVSGRRVDVDDGAPHAIAIKLEDGLLSLIIDGGIIATDAVAGSVSGIGSEDLVFGTSGRGRSFSGTISEFSIDVNMVADSTDTSSHAPFAASALDQWFDMDVEGPSATIESGGSQSDLLSIDTPSQAEYVSQDFAVADRFDFLADYVPPSEYVLI